MTGASVAIEADEQLPPWRPLVQWLLAVPHLLYTTALIAASVVVWLGIAGCVLATGQVPARLAEFQVFALRERVRTYSYFFALRSSYPPFATEIIAFDPGDDPPTHVAADGPIVVDRWSPCVRLFKMLPHLLALVPLGIVLDVLYPVWMVAAALTRCWPEGAAIVLIRIVGWL